MSKENSFGKFLAAKMQEKGFKSDEQLARKAMFIQKQLSERINIQRRTINNWRNDKAKPRSTDDPQFKLVAMALGLGDQDIARITHLINETAPLETETNSEDNSAAIQSSTPHKRFSVQPSLLISLSLVSIIIAIALGFFFLSSKSKRDFTYFETIPPTQLRVSPAGFVLPNSDTDVVNEQQLETLSSWELYVARNEIFARKGRPFVKKSSICLQNHFDSWAKSELNPDGWYVRRSGDIQLTDLEYRNAEIIRNYECKARGGQYNCNGKLNQCY